MTDHILVTYATRTGSTKGIADIIGSTLAESGAEVDVLPVEKVTDLTPYDAIVAGSAIQASEWLPEALEFVRTHQETLKQKPFAAFLACMTMAMPHENVQEKAHEFMQPVRDIVGPDAEGYFAGILDIDKIPQKQARWGFRVSVWMQVWKEGDHRDPVKIRAWAQEIQPLLMRQISDNA